jgi:spore maturation protein CgeB
MSRLPKVLVCTSFPDRMNSNPGIRHALARGFVELLGADRVMESDYGSVLDRAGVFAPDLILSVGSCLPEDCDYLPWRRYCDRHDARFIFWLTDDPYEYDIDERVLGLTDLVFTNDANSLLYHDRTEMRHLPLAASPELHYRKIGGDLRADLFFCGVAFENRKQFVADFAPYAQGYAVEILGDWWPKEIRLARNQRLSVTDICDRYNDSLLTLNLGRTLDLVNNLYGIAPSTPGPRTFEAALAGAAQCYHVDSLEITDYFTPGEEILLFDSPADLARLLQQMREDRAARDRIAQAAQRRGLAEHTYARRAATILEAAGYAVATDRR